MGSGAFQRRGPTGASRMPCRRWDSALEAPESDAPMDAKVRKATEFGPACFQPTINLPTIYTSRSAADERGLPDAEYLGACRRRNAPVFFWIHGGALTYWREQRSRCTTARGWRRRGIVVVSINYRLGVFGWLAHPELSAESPLGVSGNYGLLDQIEALQWVRRNIRAFGGDPSNVTIAGESAGALSVMYLMAAPPARGLFSKAIARERLHDLDARAEAAPFRLPSAEESGATPRRRAARAGPCRVARDGCAGTDGRRAGGRLCAVGRDRRANSAAPAGRRLRQRRTSAGAVAGRLQQRRNPFAEGARSAGLLRLPPSMSASFANAISTSPTNSCGSIPARTWRRASWRPRAMPCTDGPRSGWSGNRSRWACRPSSTSSTTAIRLPIRPVCTLSMPANCPTCSARSRPRPRIGRRSRRLRKRRGSREKSDD